MYVDNEYASYRAPTPVYDKHYFINKFEAIPDNLWCCGHVIASDGRRCALGHTTTATRLLSHSDWHTPETAALSDLFGGGLLGENQIARINDCYGPECGPKARVLAALRKLPEMNVTTNIRHRLGVDEVRIVMTAQYVAFTNWEDSSSFDPSAPVFATIDGKNNVPLILDYT